MSNVPTVYDLVDQQCNLEQIKGLLRTYKDVSQESGNAILLGGNKPDLINTLRKGVDDKFIPFDAVIKLLRECEENGEQHVFYFVPKTKDAKAICKSFDSFVEAIIGEEWEEDYPLFDFVPDTYHWVDFRKGVNGKGNDWIGKIYGQEQYFRQNDVDNSTPGRRVEYYVAETIRTVCLVRWNSPGLLEIRIDSQRLSSAKAKQSRLDRIWIEMARALSKDDFAPWDLAKARWHVKDNYQTISDVTIGDLQITDPEGNVIVVKTNTDEEELADGDFGNAVGQLGSTNDFKLVRLHWSIPDNSMADKKPLELNTVCGGALTNELMISAKTSSDAIDYVTNRLRKFNK